MFLDNSLSDECPIKRNNSWAKGPKGKKAMKNLLIAMCVLCGFMGFGCVADGEMPPADDDYCHDAGLPDEADAATPDEPDANVPPVHPTLNLTAVPSTITVGQSSTVSWTSSHATSCTIGGGAVSGTAVVYPTTTTTYTVTCVGPGGQVTKSVTVTVLLPTVCHGEYVTWTPTDVSNMDYCTGFGPEYGEAGTPLTPALKVDGGNGVCSISCYRKVTGETMTPVSVSGIWLPGATADVPRWCTTGCTRLPDHPANEADQAGGAWDGRCATPVTPLVCGPM